MPIDPSDMPKPPLDEDGRVADYARCSGCGYSLRGLKLGGNCPECGTAILVQQLPVDAEGRIATDLVCVACEYNLRGLRPADNCPECATPIYRSGASNLLRFAPPVWLKSLVGGTSWFIFNIVMSVFLAPQWVIWLGFRFLSPSSSPAVMISFYSIAYSLGKAVTQWLAYWRLTVPHPAARDPILGWNARRIARIGILWYMGASLVWGILRGNALPAMGTGSVWIKMNYFGSICISLLQILIWFALATWLQRLTTRIPNRSLTAQFRFLKWAVAIGMVLQLPMIIYFWIMTSSNSPNYGLYSALYMTSTCIRMPLEIWLLIVAAKFRRQLRSALSSAASFWSSPLATQISDSN